MPTWLALVLLAAGAVLAVPFGRHVFYGPHEADDPDYQPAEAWGVGFQAAALVFWPLLAAGAVSVLSDFGAHAHSDFYSTAAQVAPIFALAALLETGIVKPPPRQPDEDEEEEVLRRYALDIERRGRFPLFLLCQIAVTLALALYATASGYSSTFFVMSVALGLAVQGVQLLAIIYTAFFFGSGGYIEYGGQTEHGGESPGDRWV